MGEREGGTVIDHLALRLGTMRIPGEARAVERALARLDAERTSRPPRHHRLVWVTALVLVASLVGSAGAAWRVADRPATAAGTVLGGSRYDLYRTGVESSGYRLDLEAGYADASATRLILRSSGSAGLPPADVASSPLPRLEGLGVTREVGGACSAGCATALTGSVAHRAGAGGQLETEDVLYFPALAPGFDRSTIVLAVPALVSSAGTFVRGHWLIPFTVHLHRSEVIPLHMSIRLGGARLDFQSATVTPILVQLEHEEWLERLAGALRVQVIDPRGRELAPIDPFFQCPFGPGASLGAGDCRGPVWIDGSAVQVTESPVLEGWRGAGLVGTYEVVVSSRGGARTTASFVVR